MAKTYFLKFGSGNPATNTGLSPTLIYFYNQNGNTLSPPAITEALAGSGIYKFTYTPTLAIAFVADGATTGLATADRYVTASLDPIQTIDGPINDSVLGLSAVATGVINGLIPGYSLSVTGYSNTISGISSIAGLIGKTSDSFGSTSSDPSSLFGYMKRALEFNEGNALYTKSTNVWNIYSRGSSTLLISKTLADNQTSTNKT